MNSENIHAFSSFILPHIDMNQKYEPQLPTLPKTKYRSVHIVAAAVNIVLLLVALLVLIALVSILLFGLDIPFINLPSFK